MTVMDAENRRALRRTLDSAPHFSERCVAAFYRRLFAAAPGALPLFTKPESQHRMFTLAIDLMVREIDAPERLAREMAALGRRHRGKGIQPSHMAAGRRAFVEAVAEACPALAPEELQLFGRLYDQFAEAMTGRAD
ncbi:MAG: globin [Nitratireductor sp.]